MHSKITLSSRHGAHHTPFIMKPAHLLIPLLATLTAARADLVIEQKMESALQNGNMTMKIKGEKIRTDMEAGPAGAISSIVDITSGDSLTLMHAQKMAMKTSGAQTKQMVEAIKKQLGAAADGKSPASKPTDTGKSEKVGNYNAEIYTWTNPTGTYTFWVAKDFPNYAKIKDQLDKLNKAAAAGMGQGMAPDYGALPGMAVKTMIEMSGQKVTTTIVSVKEEPVDAALFDAPKDYQQMAQPGLPPAAPK